MEEHLEKCPESKVTDRQNSFLSFMESFGNTSLKKLTVYDLELWFKKIKIEYDYSDRTLLHIRSMLNHFFTYLINEGYIKASPLKPIKFKRNPQPKKERVYLTKDEARIIMNNLKEYSPKFLYPLLYGLLHTGARRSELVNLKWDQVDLVKNTLTFIETKNGTNRTVKMSSPLYELVRSQSRPSEFVFTNPDGDQIGRSQLHRQVDAFKRAYPFYKDWHCHALRHSFAYNFLKNGGQMYELQALLGHKSIQLTVGLYGQLLPEDIENPPPYEF